MFLVDEAQLGRGVFDLPPTVAAARQRPALRGAAKISRLLIDAALAGARTIRLQTAMLIDEVVDLTVVRADVDGFLRVAVPLPPRRIG